MSTPTSRERCSYPTRNYAGQRCFKEEGHDGPHAFNIDAANDPGSQPVAVPTAERVAELRDREMSDEELESYRAEVSRLLSERDAAVRRAEEAEAARAADITVLRNLADAMRSKGFDAAAGALDGVLDVQGVPQPAEDRAEKLLRDIFEAPATADEETPR